MSRFNPLVMERVMHPYIPKTDTSFSPQPSSAHPGRDKTRSGAFRLWLRLFFRNWRRRKMIATLRAMDDRLLHNIGIDRHDIAKVVDRLIDRELGMRPFSSDVERV